MDHRGGSQALILLTLCAVLYHSAAADTAWHLSEAEDKELEIQLQSLNKPYVKSFKDEYGITVDCVDIYKQPAFDHPLLKNHTLQIKSISFPKSMNNNNSSSEILKLPRRCPRGTVPIRRTTKEDLIRAKQIQQNQLIDLQDTAASRAYSVGVKFSTRNGPDKFYGISANLDVYRLSGISDDQTSSTQIIVSKGETGPAAYHNVLQAGFHVHHAAEGDSFTHFFTYWTSDGHQKTGCFNFLCPGFVQTSERLHPGQAYTLNALNLNIFKDRHSFNWMLYDGQEPIGYWPRELFNNMADSSQIQLSATASSPIDKPTPPTGNGQLDGASFRRITVTDGQGIPYPQSVRHAVAFIELGKPFYNAQYSGDCCLFYGGPGGWKLPKMVHMEGSQALVLFTLCALLYHSAAADHTARHLSEAEEKELQTQLKSLNKPYVKSFKDEYGITFDCVDMYKQPAFDHPLLKNHTLQIKSTSFPKSMNKNPSSETVKLPRRCPQGTVLIRRTTKEDLIRAKQIQRTQRIGPQEDATAGVTFTSWNRPSKFYGISADLDVFQLYGILDSQTSATHIIISKGERGPLAYRNILQAGYHVHHGAEGDNLTHFFTYWTSDGYQRTGCFNIQCAGFVQTSQKLTPGLVYTVDYLSLRIFRDPKTSNWMLFNGQEQIGYWPREILNNMADSSQIQLSATASSPTDQPSPPTGVGELLGASFSKIAVLDGALNPYPTSVRHATTFIDLGKPFYEGEYNEQCCFYYGGPGGWKPPKF
ncbi:uncharacterized protein LOC141815073 [Curcuma longa]|uniref:uncharacterized protein LOC141815073 n=1 Tax=Curcuma longa TaxID=136217 RepID=UPI003D9F24D6